MQRFERRLKVVLADCLFGRANRDSGNLLLLALGEQRVGKLLYTSVSGSCCQLLLKQLDRLIQLAALPQQVHPLEQNFEFARDGCLLLEYLVEQPGQ